MKKYCNGALLRAVMLVPLGLGAGGGVAFAAATLPTLQPGWWQTTTVSHTVTVGQPATADDPPDVTYNCESAATWAAGLKLLVNSIPGCTTDIEGSNSHYTMTMSCTNPGGSPGTIVSTGSIVYDGASAIHMVDDAKTDMPSIKLQMTDHSVEDSKWLGDCPAGTVPGDYGTMQNGVFKKSFNSLDK